MPCQRCVQKKRLVEEQLPLMSEISDHVAKLVQPGLLPQEHEWQSGISGDENLRAAAYRVRRGDHHHAGAVNI